MQRCPQHRAPRAGTFCDCTAPGVVANAEDDLDICNSGLFFQPSGRGTIGWDVFEIQREDRDAAGSERSIQAAGGRRSNGEVPQPTPLLNRLERSLVKGEAKHHHLIAIAAVKFGTHHVATRRHMAVVRPEHDLGARGLIQNPFHILGHRMVACDFPRLHL